MFPKNGLIYLLTWREHVVIRIDSTTMQEKDRLNWSGEGWGITHNRTHIFVSDGSSKLYLCNEDMKIMERKNIVDQSGKALTYINELELVEK